LGHWNALVKTTSCAYHRQANSQQTATWDPEVTNRGSLSTGNTL
jgi:hypothetical protein